MTHEVIDKPLVVIEIPRCARNTAGIVILGEAKDLGIPVAAFHDPGSSLRWELRTGS